MTISSLVLTFASPVHRCPDTLEQVRQHPAITLGPASGRKIAVLVDAESKDVEEALLEWLRDLPEIVNVAVAFVGIDDDGATDPLDQ